MKGGVASPPGFSYRRLIPSSATFGGTGFVRFFFKYEYWYSIIIIYFYEYWYSMLIRGVSWILLRGDLWNFDLISNNKMVHKFIWPSLQQTFIS